tara:strand:- start:697 stop:918 length:222 start_codon:yes stop_codon:yes gene_type:complete
MKRYEYVLRNHGLSQEDYEMIRHIFGSRDENEAIRNVNNFIKRFGDHKIGFELRRFLDAVAISAETDLDTRYN